MFAPMKTLLASVSLLVLSLGSSALADPDKAVSDQELHHTVKDHMGDLQSCMKDHGAATGKLIVQFMIEPDGHVSSSKVQHASSNHGLDQCIANAFHKWTFPKPHNHQQWLQDYPFAFSAPKAPPKGVMAEADIVDTVKVKTPEVQECLHAALQEKADTSGVLELGIVVSVEGAVTEVNVLSTGTKAPKLDACIVAKVQKWKFPKPQGGEAAFRYPFKLNIPDKK